ncbi:MAG TPA: chloride channel protein [Myxococcales bacterium]|nr:chloride channel protein [Myxococcales bacterium]
MEQPARLPRGEVPWERALLLGIAAVVGIYAGIAAGLFAHTIRFVQLLIFRSSELGTTLLGEGRARWLALFEAKLAAAHWHFEFAGIALLLLAAGGGLEVLAALRLRIPLFEAHRLRAVALAGAFGLVLYYPLVLLDTFNRTFQQHSEGGLYGLLLDAPRFLWVLGPALGAFAAALLIRYVSPESGGHGVVEVIEAVHGDNRQLRGRVALWKSLAAGLVIGSGGSAGREGPVVHLGGAIASALARFLALPRRHVALLLACGAAAGIAASFQAPLAGSMFALEIVLGDFGVSHFAPIVLASVMATMTSRALMGTGNELQAVAWTLTHPSEIGIYLILGVVSGGCAILYVRAVRASEHLFTGRGASALSKLLGKLRPELRAAAGGLLVGILALLAPRAAGTGIETMNAALAGDIAFRALLLALVVKLLATACTLGSGSPGGSFFPAVFLGAMLGGAFGRAAHWLLPSLAADPQAYAAVGMGAVVAGATTAPLTGVMMMFELTGSYQIVLPLLVACGVAAVLVQGSLGGSIYVLGARERGIDVRRSRATLDDLSVAQALERVAPIRDDLPLPALIELLTRSVHLAFPVVDASGTAVGLLSIRRVRKSLVDAQAGAGPATVRDLLQADVPPRFVLDDDLGLALRRLADLDASEGLVLDGEDPAAAPLGIITRESILEAWRRGTS